MGKKRLLVVDDEPRLLRAVAADLRGEGYEVTTAHSGAAALSLVALEIPDLIVSDIRMPVMDGFAFARRLREHQTTALIPIIFLTARDTTSDRVQGFRAGVDAYLTKPFEPDELLAIIASILQRVERTHSQITRLVTNSNANSDDSPLIDEALTLTESKIAGIVARGLSNKDIAKECNISVRTVEHHIRSILAKKNLSNRVEIALFVRERQK